MPRRKISLEEAYGVFEQHGLAVEIKGIVKEQPAPLVAPHELFEGRAKPVRAEEQPRRVGKKMTRIVLRTQQTIASSGEAVYNAANKLIRIDGQHMQSYGPGVVYVPTELAGDLLHQDQLAVQADQNLLSATFKSYVILQAADGRNVARLASVDHSFDMSGFLGKLGESGHAIQLPF